MPSKLEYYQVYGEKEPPQPTEYPSREAAEVEAKRLEVETGKEYEVLSADRWVTLDEEKQSQETMYVLTREDCNGEYGVNGHWSLHKTIEGAKALHAKVVNPQDLKGEDAINEWRPYEYEEGILRFQTGNWGYVVWEIRPLKVLP